MKDIKEYLHYYLGCECMIGDLKWKSQNISKEDRAPYTDPEFGKPIKSVIDLHSLQHFSHKLTPILRPLSDMTPSEHINGSIEWTNALNDVPKDASDWIEGLIKESARIKYLTKHGFDLFGLIDAGLAIAKT